MVFDSVYDVCYDGIENHTDDVIAKFQVPQAKKSFKISAQHFIFYMNWFKEFGFGLMFYLQCTIYLIFGSSDYRFELISV